ncbi:hypothetical protein LJC56_00035 [Christensenellaceae bacterium OttesenSCG-928-K19]|nr:hypothetical protein [Christensenellaceae bacterium OttesenSCG-928-K19]
MEQTPMQEPAASQQPNKKKNNTKRVVLIVVCCVVAVVAIAGAYIGTSKAQYDDAVAQLQQHEYDQASFTLSKIPEFVAQDLPQLKALAAAGVLFESGAYKDAQSAFEELGDFLYSLELAEECAQFDREERLAQAEALFSGGDAEQAEELFDSVKAEVDVEEQNQIDLTRALLYYDAEKYDASFEIAKELSDYPGAKDLLVSSAVERARVAEDTGNFYVAYSMVTPYLDSTIAQEYVHSLREGLYQQGVSYAADYIFEMAKPCFDAAGNYKDATDYLKIMELSNKIYQNEGDGIFELLPYIDNEVAHGLMHEYYLPYYLKGTWRGDGYMFEAEDDGYSSDLPGTKDAPQCYFIEGTAYLRDADGNTAEWVDIKIIDRDTIEVYAYSNEKTYTLTRR